MAELAAIGTVGSIAASGAKLAILLYTFSTTVAGAKKEVVSVAESISIFCTVLKLLGSTLEKQESARFSVSALSTVYEILDHCHKQFDEILAVVNKLQKERDGGCEAGKGEGKKAEVEVDVMARVKWVFKRGEVKRMQRDLDSMKLTLGIMLQALEFRKVTVNKRYSAVQRATELEETQCVVECLIAAQNANEEELALLEEETDLGPSASSPARGHSWRASTYLADPIDPASSTDARKQFQNLVHMWAETGESSTSGRGGEVSSPAIRRRNHNVAPTLAVKLKDSEPPYAPNPNPNLGKPDKPDRTVIGGRILTALTKFRQPREPDYAIFRGDLDQVRVVAEQEEPEWEPKADTIRGAAALLRRISATRAARETNIFEHPLDRALQDRGQTGDQPVEYEWDGLRRRRRSIDDTNTAAESRQPRRRLPPLGAAFPVVCDDEDDNPYGGILSKGLSIGINHLNDNQGTTEQAKVERSDGAEVGRRQFSFQNMFQRGTTSSLEADEGGLSASRNLNLGGSTMHSRESRRGQEKEEERLKLIHGFYTNENEEEEKHFDLAREAFRRGDEEEEKKEEGFNEEKKKQEGGKGRE